MSDSKMVKVANILKEKGLPALAQAVTGNPVGAVTTLLGFFGTSNKDEVIEKLSNSDDAIEALKEKEIELTKLILQDKADARKMNSTITTSNNAPWITRTVPAILAIMLVTIMAIILILALAGVVDSENQIAMLVINSITAMATICLTFYFGGKDEKD